MIPKKTPKPQWNQTLCNMKKQKQAKIFFINIHKIGFFINHLSEQLLHLESLFFRETEQIDFTSRG